MLDIPFNIPYVSGREEYYLLKVFENQHFAGNGPFTKRVQEFLEIHLGSKRVLLTHSCTAGLEIAALVNNIKPGDEVIMPSFTFVTTASSMLRSGAVPIFCEIDPETMVIDLKDAAKRITKRTKAIIPVHYAGFSPNMNSVLDFADSYNIQVIEDAAQGLGSTWNNQPLGTFAPLSAISFHETKNIHSGLGGCLVINDEDIITRAETIWERGTNRSAFFKGLVDKYSWVELGSSFYPSELQAAFLLAQLESLDENLNLRRTLWNHYFSRLLELEKNDSLRILKPPKNVIHNSHMFAIILPNPQLADSLRQYLNSKGIEAVIHYVPLHISKMGEKLGWKHGDLPITENSASCLLRLPLHHQLTTQNIDQISRKIIKFLSIQSN